MGQLGLRNFVIWLLDAIELFHTVYALFGGTTVADFGSLFSR